MRRSRRPIPFGPPLPTVRVLTVGALAVAARRANAVGAVRLTCTPKGLEIELVRAFGYQGGFAPSGVVDAVSFRVPYVAVRGLVREGKTLHLALDPRAASPHNRFALARFTENPGEALARAHLARARAKVASWLVPFPLGLMAAALTPPSLASGAIGLAAVVAIVAGAAWFGLRELVSWATWGGPISDRYRDAFEAELARKLGLDPSPVLSIGPGEIHAPPPAMVSPAFTRNAIATASFAAVVVLVLALGRHALTASPDAVAPVAIAEPGLAAAALSRAAATTTEKALPSCLCARADSPLWKDGVPVASILTFERPDDASTDVAPVMSKDRGRYDFDLAVVDNASKPIRDVRVTLTFARRNKKGKRVGATDRGLFWEGALPPGHAVKWHVKAPGTEMRIDTSVTGTLDPSAESAAPPDAFFELLGSRYRAVRVHALEMLAYLRDPRALDQVHALGSVSPTEETKVHAIARAAAPVFACNVTREDDNLTACLFNGSSRRQRTTSLRIPGGSDLALDVAVPVHEGVVVSVPFEGDLPADLEIVTR